MSFGELLLTNDSQKHIGTILFYLHANKMTLHNLPALSGEAGGSILG